MPEKRKTTIRVPRSLPVKGKSTHIRIFKFDPVSPVANATAGFSVSRNLGDFNNAGVMVVISMPCYPTEIVACRGDCSSFAKLAAQKLVDEMGRDRRGFPAAKTTKQRKHGVEEVDLEEAFPILAGSGSSLPVGTVFVQRSVAGKETGASDKISVPTFATASASVTVILRRTINFGSGDNAKVVTGGTLPCYREEIACTIAWLVETAKRDLRTEIDALG